MKKLISVIFAVLAFVSSSAQLKVHNGGRLLVGALQNAPLSTSKDSTIWGFEPFSQNDIVLPPFRTVDIDSLAAMCILGKSKNNSSGYITFGDRRFVSVGEWGGMEDSNTLLLRGTGGIRYETDKGRIFGYTPSGSTSTPFVFSCDVRANGVLLNSDVRMKKNISGLDGESEGLEGINPISYQLEAASQPSKVKSNGGDGEQIVPPAAPDSRRRFGFSAQEVKEIFPELVKEDEDGYLCVDYIGFIPLLVDAVKSLRSEVEQQRETINQLTAGQAAPTRAPRTSGIDGPAEVKASLSQNKPNPFSSTTKIDCVVPEEVADASIRIYDLQGKQVINLPVENRGATTVSIDGSSLSAGMYIYALIADGVEIDSKRMILTD